MTSSLVPLSGRPLLAHVSTLLSEAILPVSCDVLVADCLVRVSWEGPMRASVVAAVLDSGGLPLRSGLSALAPHNTSSGVVSLHRRFPVSRIAVGYLHLSVASGSWVGFGRGASDALDREALEWEWTASRVEEVAARLFLDDLGLADEVLPTSAQLFLAAGTAPPGTLRSPREYLRAAEGLCR